MRELELSREADGTWTVRSAQVPGFTARGRNEAEAMTAMRRALTFYFPCGDCEDDAGAPR